MLLALLLATAPLPVSVRSLMHEMVDLDRLTNPLPYKHAQASSYDRRSDPGPNSDPFANGDAGQFIRIESVNGRKEYVMADLKGPGVVDRLWSANPTGRLRFYFDGESTPRFQADMAELLTGKIVPFTAPFGYDASRGENLYFPFPYAKSLKITVDDSAQQKPTSLYYHVGYRTYTPDAPVATFDQASLNAAMPEIERVRKLVDHPRPPAGSHIGPIASTIPSGKTVRVLNLARHGVVREFDVNVTPMRMERMVLPWSDPRQMHNVLRTLLLTIRCEGKVCVSTPLGDFFGSAPGLNPYTTLAASMAKDGTMSFKLPMPFSNGLTASIENIGPNPQHVKVSAVVDTPNMPALFRLHAQWTSERSRTRPFKDMNFLNTRGAGTWVGCSLHIANPVAPWWGEGDEKAYVDGESFPSTFGTGTEDFFGYAWGSPDLFQKPYHAQSRADGPGNMGHASVVRWQLFDPIPYKTSLKFDLEKWHWADVIATYDRTAYWYAETDTPGPVAINRALLLPEEIKPFRVEGAIEGEALANEKTGGVVEVQSGFGELSDGKQLWWRNAAVGDRLTIKIPVAQAGTYEVIAAAGHARDYGNFTIKVNGQDAGTHDFYQDNLEWKQMSLGTFRLSKGDATLELTVLQPNAAAAPSNMFGLDYVLLKRK
jgi:hypothetical protein